MRKWLIVSFLLFFVVFSTIVFGIQIPFVQIKLVQFATERLSKLVKYPIKIGGVKVAFTGGLILENVEINDKRSFDMIKVKEVRASFKLVSLLGKDVIIKKLVLEQADVKLKYYPEINDVNLSDFIRCMQHIGQDSAAIYGPKPIHVGRYSNFIIEVVELENSKFSFDDIEKTRVTDRFDFSKFSLDSIYITASKFKIVADTVSMNIKNLKCIDDFSKLKVGKLDADFLICEQKMKIENLDASIGNSIIKHAVVFDYQGFRQLSYIQDSVFLNLNFKDSFIDTRDASFFFPELKNLNDRWKVSGNLKGYFHDFDVRNFDISFGKSSTASGNAQFKGLPNLFSTLLKIKLNTSNIAPIDLKPYGLQENVFAILPFGNSKIVGEFEGKYHDFRFNGNIDSEIGAIDADFKLSFNENNILKSAVYKGLIGLENFDARKFGTPSWISAISLNLKLDGKGFELENSNFNASGFISSIGLMGYNYKNSLVSLRYANKKGQGSLDIQDSNIVMDLIVKCDFNKSSQKLASDAHISRANIYKLGLYGSPLKLSTDLSFFSTGFDPKTFEFNIDARNTSLDNNFSKALIPTIAGNYKKKNDSIRVLKIDSEIGNVLVNGNFELFKLKGELDLLKGQIQESFNGGLYSFTNSREKSEIVDIKFNVEINKAKPIFQIFTPSFSVSEGSRIYGNLATYKGVALDFYAKMDSLQYKQVAFVDNAVEINLDKSLGNSPLYCFFDLKSANQLVENQLATEKFSLNAIWKENEINFESYLKQINEPNEAKFEGKLAVGSINKVLSFGKAEFNALNSKWNINLENKILFGSKSINFENVELKCDSQLVSLNGELSENKDKSFNLVLKKFRFQNLDKIVNRKLEGFVDGNLTINDFFTEPKVNSIIDAKQLTINKLYIGNISGKSNWDYIKKRIDLNLDIERYGNKMFSLAGYYAPNLEIQEERLNIEAKLNKTNIVIFEPFVKDIFSNLKGNASGTITLNGSLTRPLINGEIEVDGGAFKVDYLNSTYYFDEKFSINPTGFIMNNIILNDSKGGLAVVEGGIYHKNFKDFKIRIEGAFKNLKLLSTSSKDNEIYYGDAIGSGNFTLKGNLNELDIDLQAKAQKGTQMSIIYNSASNTDRQSFIKFVSPGKDSLVKKKAENETVLPMFKVKANLDVDITDEAYAEFVLDKNTGDKISGYGKGKIKLNFSTDGEFTMVGDYTFSKDSYYLFTFLNVINKKFTIQQGSKVKWNGDPAAGILDVSARYEDRISLQQLVDTIYWNRAGIKTPYPVATILYLTGDLLKPEINYDIKIFNYPTVIADVPLFSYVSAFENKIRNNVNEMNTQVFSLLVFRRFLYGTAGIEGVAGSTVSELLTNQLSQIVSRLDKNLQVDFRMNGLDRAALNTVQLRVSYEFLDGKIRITRSGSVTNAQSQATTSSIIGDISVEYMLTNDGRFRLKGFTRQNPNLLSIGSQSQGNSSTGASLLHTTSFDSLNPFDRKKKKSKKKK